MRPDTTWFRSREPQLQESAAAHTVCAIAPPFRRRPFAWSAYVACHPAYPNRREPYHYGAGGGSVQSRHCSTTRPASCARASLFDGRAAGEVFDREQRATHGLAWLATYVEAIRQLSAYAERLQAQRAFWRDRGTSRPHRCRRISRADFMAVSPCRKARSRDWPTLASTLADVAARWTPALDDMIASGNTAGNRARLVELIARSRPAPLALWASMKRSNRFARKCAVSPTARSCLTLTPGTSATNIFRTKSSRRWLSLACSVLRSRKNSAAWGLARKPCALSPRSFRAAISASARSARARRSRRNSFIAGGTDTQKRKWLPRIASGETLPTAVFTEPNTGSDLAAISTRAVKTADGYQRAWQQDMDHASRARRPDDAACAYRPEADRPSRPVDVAGRKAARK